MIQFFPNLRMAESIDQILRNYKVSDLLDRNSDLYKRYPRISCSTIHYSAPPETPISLDGNLSVRDACEVLSSNKITSAPISLDGKFIGQLEMADLVSHILQVLVQLLHSNVSRTILLFQTPLTGNSVTFSPNLRKPRTL